MSCSRIADSSRRHGNQGGAGEGPGRRPCPVCFQRELPSGDPVAPKSAQWLVGLAHLRQERRTTLAPEPRSAVRWW
jgi:hypothetical protein